MLVLRLEGAMTRDQAIALVQLYDHLFPKKYLKDYLKYFEISNNQLNKIIDKFANKKVLVKEKLLEAKFYIHLRKYENWNY